MPFSTTRSGLVTAGLVLLAAALPVAVLSYRAVPLIVGVAILLLAIGRDRGPGEAGFDPWLVSLLGAFLILAAVSLAWTLNLPSAARTLAFEVVLFAGLACAGWWASPRLDPGRLALILAAGLVAGALLLLVEMRLGMVVAKVLGAKHASAKINQAAVALAVWCWPILSLAARRWGRAAAGLLWLLTMAAVLSSESESAKVGLILGTLGFLLWQTRWAWLAWLVAGGIAALVLVQPWFADLVAGLVAQMGKSFKGAHAGERLVIWQAFAEAIRMRPLFGFGFNASGWIGQGSLLEAFPEALRDGIRDSHPHDMFLQVWVELGAVGAVIVAGLLARAGWLAARLPGTTRAWAVASFVTAALVALVGYGAWQAWWTAILAGLVVLVRAVVTANETETGVGA